MNRAAAIEQYRMSLLGHVMALFAMIGLTEGMTLERIPKPLHRGVLLILRTAESAARRLIMAAARNIVVDPPEPRTPKPRQAPSAKPKLDGEASPKRKRKPSFNMFDPLKRYRHRGKKRSRRVEPHVYSLEAFLQAHAPAAPAPADAVDDGMVNAAPLIRRLQAALDALQNIPRYALRLALWQARPKEDRRPERWSPIRAGRPPGFRQRHIHEVDQILKECHWLAIEGHPPLDDTS